MVLLALTFVLWGVGDVFRNRSLGGNVVQVGDRSLSQQEFVAEFKDNLKILERQFGRPLSAEDIKNPQLKQIIMNQIVNKLLVEEISKDMKLGVSDDMVKFEIASLPMFQREGKFDKALFDVYLSNANMSEAMFIHLLKEDIKSQTMSMIFAVSRLKEDSIKELMTQARGQTRVVKLLNITNSNVKVTDTPTEEELNKIYESTQDKFSIPERRDISYAVFGMEAIDGNFEPSDADLQALYEARKMEFSEPEKRKVHQMVFKSKEKADAAFAQLKSGKSFTDVAAAEFPNKKDFVLGELTRNGLSQDIADPIFGAVQGGYTDVVQSPLGFHLFMVESITPGKTKSLSDVKNLLRTAYINEKKSDKLTQMAQAIDKDVLIGKSMKDISEKYGLKVDKKVQISKSGSNSFDNSSFSTDEGMLSMVTPMEGQDRYFVLSVDRVYPKTFKDLTEVKPDLIRMWMDRRADDEMREVADGAHKMLISGKSMEDVIKQYGLSAPKSINISLYSESAKGLSYEFLKDVYSSKVGHYMDVTRDNGEYQIGYLSQIIDADMASLNDKMEMSNAELAQTVPNELFSQMLDAARKKYGVEINHKFIEDLEL